MFSVCILFPETLDQQNPSRQHRVLVAVARIKLQGINLSPKQIPVEANCVFESLGKQWIEDRVRIPVERRKSRLCLLV